jgi:hypothetical protein
LTDTGAAQQTNIERLLDSASAAIDRFCNRPDGFLSDAAASVRVYPGSGQPYQLIDECTEVTLVSVKDDITDVYTDWLPADWIACTGDYHYPDFNSLPYTMIVCEVNGDYSVFTSGRYDVPRWQAPTVQVTARWGYSATVPDQIKTATIMQSARWFKRLQGAMSDSLASGELGQLLFLQKLDPDIAMILKDGRFMHPATGRW